MKASLIIVGLAVMIGLTVLIQRMNTVPKEVPDVNWYHSFEYKSKTAHGYWLFTELVKERFGNAEISRGYDYGDTTKVGEAAIITSEYMYGVDEVFPTLVDYAARGNTLVVISTSTNYLGEQLGLHDEYTIFTAPVVEIGGTDYDIELHEYNFTDSTDLGTHSLSSDSLKIIDSVLVAVSSPLYYDDEEPEVEYAQDSADAWPQEEVQLPRKVVYQFDTVNLFSAVSVGKGTIMLHSVPSMFSNVHHTKPYYLPHFNRFFQNMDATKVTLTYPPSSFNATSSPLGIFLSKRGFRWAFYALLTTGLLYVVFAGKRRQKYTRLINAKKNTSLEFVESITKLHLSQNRYDRLALKIQDNFYHKVYHQFGLNRRDPEFWTKLERISKADEGIMSSLETAMNPNLLRKGFTEDSIVKYSNQFETFFEKIDKT